MVMNGGSRISRSDRAVFRELGGAEGAVLLHLDTAAYHGVNEVGALIWTLLDDITFEELLALVTERLDRVPAHLADDVDEFLSDLASRELIRIEIGHHAEA